MSEGGLFAFKSADAINWSLMRDKPVITKGAFDSQNIAFWDVTRGHYRTYYRVFTEGITTKEQWAPAGIRAIQTGTSKDFLKWSNFNDLAYVDSPPEELYTNQVAPYYRAPHILIGMPTRYLERGWSESMRALPERKNRELRASSTERYGTALTDALLMASRDGVKFKRWNEAFLRPGIERPGTWQYGQQYIAWNVVETASTVAGAPNELSLYATEDYWHGKGGTVRRYTLRMDGFVSVFGSAKRGEILSKPLTFDGTKLSINFATSIAGGIRVEIQNNRGKPFEGFALADCEEQFGDSLERTVTWKKGADVGALAGEIVRLRFELRDADLFSLQFTP